MSTRLEAAKFRAQQMATLRSEYGYDMAALLNSIDDNIGYLEDIEALLNSIDGTNDSLPTIVTILNSLDNKNNALAAISSLLTSIDGKTVTTPVSSGRVQVEPLGVPMESRPMTATTSSTAMTLSSTCRRISIVAVNGPIRYAVAASPTNPVANSTSHFVNTGERLDFGVPANGRIAVIRAGTADVQVEISEYS